MRASNRPTDVRKFYCEQYVKISIAEYGCLLSEVMLSRGNEKEFAYALALALESGILDKDTLYRMLDAAFGYVADKKPSADTGLTD